MISLANMNNTVIRQVWAPLALYVGFFLVKAMLGPTEIVATYMAIAAVAMTFALWYEEGELGLFIIGVILGIIIEVGLTGVAGERQQVWLNASFFGIPYWLPIVWGVAFIIIPRFSAFMHTHKMR